MQESPHRAASQFETASDLPQTHALVMQSSYGLVSRLPLGPSVVLLTLQPRQTFAGKANWIGDLGLYCRRDWSLSRCGDQFFRGSPNRNMLASEQTLHCFSQIDQNVEAVRHLDSRWCSSTGALGICAGSVSADDLDASLQR
jgi:hypothetical protein